MSGHGETKADEEVPTPSLIESEHYDFFYHQFMDALVAAGVVAPGERDRLEGIHILMDREGRYEAQLVVVEGLTTPSEVSAEGPVEDVVMIPEQESRPLLTVADAIAWCQSCYDGGELPIILPPQADDEGATAGPKTTGEDEPLRATMDSSPTAKHCAKGNARGGVKTTGLDEVPSPSMASSNTPQQIGGDKITTLKRRSTPQAGKESNTRTRHKSHKEKDVPTKSMTGKPPIVTLPNIPVSTQPETGESVARLPNLSFQEFVRAIRPLFHTEGRIPAGMRRTSIRNLYHTCTRMGGDNTTRYDLPAEIVRNRASILVPYVQEDQAGVRRDRRRRFTVNQQGMTTPVRSRRRYQHSQAILSSRHDQSVRSRREQRDRVQAATRTTNTNTDVQVVPEPNSAAFSVGPSDSARDREHSVVCPTNTNTDDQVAPVPNLVASSVGPVDPPPGPAIDGNMISNFIFEVCGVVADTNTNPAQYAYHVPGPVPRGLVWTTVIHLTVPNEPIDTNGADIVILPNEEALMATHHIFFDAVTNDPTPIRYRIGGPLRSSLPLENYDWYSHIHDPTDTPQPAAHPPDNNSENPN